MSVSELLEDEVGQQTEEVIIEKGHGAGPPAIPEEPLFDPGDDGSNGETGKPFGNALIAMLLFIGADIMFFAGLIGAFIIFRFGAEDWPPPGQPVLPLGVTGVNTAILLLSGVAMIRAWRSLSNWNRPFVSRWLTYAAIGGVVFLLVQGYEWIRLIGFGVTLSSGIYGGTFYVLIGCHALHVLSAVVWLLVVVAKLRLRSAYGPNETVGIKLIGMYWLLVVALWPILYGLVYLS